MSDDVKRVAWNTSEGLIWEIVYRRKTANGFFITGDIKKALNTLISIKQSVIQSLDADERKKLQLIEEKFYQISFALTDNSGQSFNSDERALYVTAKEVARKIYSKYNDLLMDLLEKYGYLIGEQTDASKMKF